MNKLILGFILIFLWMGATSLTTQYFVSHGIVKTETK